MGISAAAATQPIPLASSITRFAIGGALGFAPMVAVPLHFDWNTENADAHGRSPHRLDRAEARQWTSGSTGPIRQALLVAGLAVGALYTINRGMISPRELGALKIVYGGLGGALVGTIMAPKMLRPLPQPEPAGGTMPNPPGA